MLTFKSPTRNSKKKSTKSLDAPFLVSLEATAVMAYLYDWDDYKTNVVNFNFVTADKTLHVPLKSILNNIQLSLKKTILKDTLPTNFPSLQELYPSSRNFYNLRARTQKNLEN